LSIKAEFPSDERTLNIPDAHSTWQAYIHKYKNNQIVRYKAIV